MTGFCGTEWLKTPCCVSKGGAIRSATKKGKVLWRRKDMRPIVKTDKGIGVWGGKKRFEGIGIHKTTRRRIGLKTASTLCARGKEIADASTKRSCLRSLKIRTDAGKESLLKKGQPRRKACWWTPDQEMFPKKAKRKR